MTLPLAVSREYLGPFKTSMIQILLRATIFAKCSIIDILHDPKYVSVYSGNNGYKEERQRK